MTANVELATRPHSGYRHEAFLYRGDAEFTDGCVSFLRAGLEAGEPAMVAVVPRRLRLLRDALGRDADAVTFVDMASLGRNPARILPAWAEFVAGHAADRQPIRGIGEPIWAGRRPEEIAECQLHEALLNVAIDPDVSFWLRCPYDAGTLPERVLGDVERSHPVLVGPDDYRGSTGYGGLHHVQTLFSGRLPEPVDADAPVCFGADDLPTLRGLVTRTAAASGIHGDRVSDLELAVHEIATNSLRHGGGEGRFRVWLADDALTCEISDAGRIADPLVGRVPPSSAAESGRGVSLANQLSDLLQIRSSDDGTTVRISAWL